MQDALSDVMQRVRLRACVYFQRDFHSPWAMCIQNTGYAQFHVISRGNCTVTVQEVTHNCASGDILLFPRGQAHVLADAPGRQAVPGPQAMASFATDQPCFDGPVQAARVICGHYEYRLDFKHPLLADLPEFVHLRTADPAIDDMTAAVLPLILRELARPRPGQNMIVERMAEVLLVQTLRAYYQINPPSDGFFAGLSDARLERAISRIHQDYGQPIGLADLAQTAAMSRSSFAQTFKQKLSVSPVEYLAKWRMLVASDVLKTTNLPVADVAEQVGYLSDIAFVRAFKREFGQTPSALRRQA